jgi:very-long-chain (3R)-3-hydroxyacyl-CoA dehydratase
MISLVGYTAVGQYLTALRYNAFLILYPLGLASEAGLVYLSLTEATEIRSFYRGYLLAGLLTYAPGKHDVGGFYVTKTVANLTEAGPYLYMHMLSQRRKVSKKPQEKKGQ